MTYTLIELVKDNVESWFTELSKHQPTKSVAKVEEQLTEDISAMVRSYFMLPKNFVKCHWIELPCMVLPV